MKRNLVQLSASMMSVMDVSVLPKAHFPGLPRQQTALVIRFADDGTAPFFVERLFRPHIRGEHFCFSWGPRTNEGTLFGLALAAPTPSAPLVPYTRIDSPMVGDLFARCGLDEPWVSGYLTTEIVVIATQMPMPDALATPLGDNINRFGGFPVLLGIDDVAHNIFPRYVVSVTNRVADVRRHCQEQVSVLDT